MEPRQLPVVVALGAVSATLVVAFGRVFATGDYVLPLLLAALLPHAICALTRWRGLSSAASIGASTAGLLVLLIVTVPDVITDLGGRLSGGWRVITVDEVPIRATHGAVLLAAIVVWIAAVAADELAFRRQASLGALAPGLMVLIWIAALGLDDGQWVVVAAFGACASVFLGFQHQVLLEHRRTRLGPRRVVDAPRFLAAGAVTAVVAIGLGVAAAPVLPGGDKPLFETSGSGRENSGDSYRTSVPPLLDVGDKLRLGDEQVLFSVEAEREDYWRIVALDKYRSVGGGQWTLTAEGDERVAEGLDESDAEFPLEQHFRIRGLSERWMPAAFEPVEVSTSDVLVVRSSSTLVTLEDSVFGMRYTVISNAPTLALDDSAAARSDDPVPDELREFTDLPGDFPASVIEQAELITAGLATPYERALALREFFRDGSFTYDPSVEFGDDEAAIVSFLESKNGYCVQFASAYATMARAIGIPARVAVGFTPGTLEDGVYKVTNHDAHAWPEVWLGESIGWTHAFDPTPPSASAPGGSDLPGEPEATTAPVTPTTTVTSPTTGSTTVTSPPSTTPVTGTDGGVTVDPDPNTTDEGAGGVPWFAAVVLAVLVLILGPIAIVLGLKASRRSRRRRHADPAVAITGAWAEAVDDLTDHRHAWAPSSTPLEVARQVPVRAGDTTAEPLRALADAYGAVRYGAAQPDPDEVDDVWDHVDTLHRELGRSLGFVGRLRARMDPSTLRRREPVSSGVGRASPQEPDPAGWSKPRKPSTND